jgi:hypothetical protein
MWLTGQNQCRAPCCTNIYKYAIKMGLLYTEIDCQCLRTQSIAIDFQIAEYFQMGSTDQVLIVSVYALAVSFSVCDDIPCTMSQ